MGEIAIGISIAALVVSIISPIFEFFWNRKMNTQNLSSEYFMNIYGELIFNDLPIAREYIHFDGSKITGTDRMITALRTMRQRSIYFKRTQPLFYEKIIQEIQALEDYLVNTNAVADNDKFVAFHNKVDEHLETILACISDTYLGKGTKRKKNI